MILTAELRKCTILFINIKVDVELVMSAKGTPKKTTPLFGRQHLLKSLPFIARSSEEKEGDEKLLEDLQRCMEITSLTLTENGGQIRQFIHDDKGTVCIGTIGLRGSTTEDNSAAAVEAARSIIAQLQAIGLDASIGIASGKAFCGLVGSSVRHEYAVMGPSVNLSARLMGAAEMGTILCDEKTRESDRRHRYLAKSAINAKGFIKPVSIFKPLTNVHGRVLKKDFKGMKIHRHRSNKVGRNSSFGSLATMAQTQPSPIPLHRERSRETISSSDEESDLSADEFGSMIDSALVGRAAEMYKIQSFLISDEWVIPAIASPPVSGHASSVASVMTCPATVTFAASAFSASHQTPSSTPPITRSQSAATIFKPSISNDNLQRSYYDACAALSLNLSDTSASKNSAPQKMKLVIVSGPYGIGKSSVLKTVYQKVQCVSSLAAGTGFKYKYNAQANSYNKTTPFFVWKKILSHLLTALNFNFFKPASNDPPSLQYNRGLSSVPENYEQDTGPDSPRGGSQLPRRAVITANYKMPTGSRKHATVYSNIRQLVLLMDPSLRELEPLLFSGFLSR